MHRTGRRVARQRHAAQDVADGSQGTFDGFIKKIGHQFAVPGHQQKPLAGLGQTAQFAAVVCSFRRGVTVGAQQPYNLIQQPASPRCDTRDVLEYNQLNGIVLERLQRKPDTAQISICLRPDGFLKP